MSENFVNENEEQGVEFNIEDLLGMMDDGVDVQQNQVDPLAFERYVDYNLMEEVLFETEVYDSIKQSEPVKWAEEIGLAYHTLLAIGMSRAEAYEMVFNKATFDHNIKMQEIGKETAIAQSEAVIGNQTSNAL